VANTGRIRVVRRDPAELTDSQLDTILRFRSKRSDLIDKIEAAARAGDREQAWELAQALSRMTDEALKVTE
jgi:hypothetical protein